MKRNGQDTTDPSILQNRSEQLVRSRARYVSNRDAILRQQKEYYREHRDEKLERNRKFYAEHRDELAPKYKEYREKNHDAVIKRGRDYWKSHRAELLIKKKLYNDAHKKERSLKERIRCAIKSGKPQERIDELRKELDSIMKGGEPK